MLAGRMEMVDQPDPVGPYEETEQSVFLGLDAGQVVHLPPNKVHPGVEMSHTEPVADGPAGRDRTRRPVGNDAMYAVHDVMYGPEIQMYRAKGGSESAAGIPDPVIRTGGGVRTDDMNFDTMNGQSGSSVVSPSSDSGVHSLDEQWECMSTDSGNSDSIQSIKTVYGGFASQADNHLVLLRHMDTYDRGVVLSLQEKYGKHDSMSYLSTNGHNSDIAAMSDFSDEEDEPREEVGPHDDVQPNIQTDWVGNDTIKKVSNSYDYSLLHKVTTEVAPHAPDPNDEDYWTKFRLLTKEAFKLDDVKLSESEYPDAVKELVFRSRLTIMEINERDDVRFEELHDSDDDGDSDRGWPSHG